MNRRTGSFAAVYASRIAATTVHGGEQVLEGLSPIHFILILAVSALMLGPVVVLVLFLRAAQGPRRPDPRAVLADRLARGQITPDEFATAMRALGLGPSSSWGSSAEPTTWGAGAAAQAPPSDPSAAGRPGGSAPPPPGG
jgi:uncharacterized membrane protein